MALTTISPALQDTQAQYTGFKNRIINGAMMIDQRNAGASVTPGASTYLVDRFRMGISGGTAGKYSVQQVSDAPNGFVNSLKFTVVSAYSVSAADIISLQQSIEGNNCADFAWGTANAQTVTLSFWVKSSLTGTFGGAFTCGGATSSSYNPFTYTINAANTWEYKTLTVTGPTTNPVYTDTNAGPNIFWSLGVGSTYTGTPGTWGTTQYRNATGTVSIVATAGATWQITGVQLEKGSTATSFDYRPYGTELALCQRYYQAIYGTGGGLPLIVCGYASASGQIGDTSYIGHKVSMRTAPTVTKVGSWSSANLQGYSISDITAEYTTTYVVGNAAGTVYTYASAATAGLTFSSEL